MASVQSSVQSSEQPSVTGIATRPAVVVAAGLVGGYAVARFSGKRQLGGAVFAAAVAVCERQWARSAGPGPAAALGVIATAGMGLSHPLSKKIGAWPAVFVVAGIAAAASEAVTRRR